MGPHLIPRHLAICENRKEGIDGVVGESPAILRERRWARGIIRGISGSIASGVSSRAVTPKVQKGTRETHEKTRKKRGELKSGAFDFLFPFAMFREQQVDLFGRIQPCWRPLFRIAWM